MSSLDCDNPLSDIINIHKDKPAFVFGGGRSAQNFDLTKIPSNGIILACNNSVILMNKCNYFCMTDGSIPCAKYFNHGYNICDNILMCGGKGFRIFPPVVSMFEKIKDKTMFFNRRYKNPSSWSFNYSDGLLIAGTDIVHVTSHIAHVMGCNPIILVGVDLCYTDGLKYCESKEFGILDFYDTMVWKYDKPLPSNDDNDLQLSYCGWKSIKKQNSTVNFLNTNPNGRLINLFKLYEVI